MEAPSLSCKLDLSTKLSASETANSGRKEGAKVGSDPSPLTPKQPFP